MFNNYGVLAAKKRTKEKVQKQAEKLEKKLKNSEDAKKKDSIPKIDFFDIDKSNVEPFTYINWQANEEISKFLSNEFLENQKLFKLLKMPTGTGKTAVAVKTLGEICKKSPDIKIIILATKKIIESGGWDGTIKSYNEFAKSKVINPMILTTIDKFARILSNGKSLKELLKAIGTNDAIIVLDECHKYKNPTSKRAKQLHKLSHIKKLGLSATPIVNDIIMDMSSYLIMDGCYQNKTDFMRKSGLNDYLGKFQKLLVYDNFGNVNENLWSYYKILKEEFSGVLFQPEIELKDLNMPNVINKVLSVEANQQILDNYASLENAYKNRMFDGIVDFILEAKKLVNLDKSRLDILTKIIKDDKHKQPLIFYQHNSTKFVLLEHLKSLGYDDVQVIAGKTNIKNIDRTTNNPILMQYQAISEGVDFLNSNCSIFYENQYSHLILTQAKGRNVRRNMKEKFENVFHYQIVSPILIDNEIFKSSLYKEKVLKDLYEEIELLIENK